MAVDKLVDSTQLDADLTSVANAIRTKGGTSASLAFPSGFVTAIGNISGGGSGNVIYTLPQATTFNGSSTYIDTGIYLMSGTYDEFTIEFTITNGSSQAAYTSVWHCVTESDADNYPGLSFQRNNKTTYYMIGGLKSTSLNLVANSTDSGKEIKAVLRRSHAIGSDGYFYELDYTVDDVYQTKLTRTIDVASNKSLLLGCYQQNNGTKGRYWKGTMSDFTIRDVRVDNDYVTNYLFDTSSEELLSIILGETI